MPPRRKKADGDSWISDEPGKDGYYHAHVSMGTGLDGNPDRRHRASRSLNALRAKVKKLEAQRDAGKVTGKGRKPTVREMLERHITVTLVARNRAPKTIRSYLSLCENHIYPMWGAIRIDQLRDDQIEEGIARMRAKGLAASTARKMLAVLSSAYALQVERGKVARNPCDTVEPPQLPQQALRALSEDEAVTVIESADGRPNAVRWSVGLGMGLRQGEALGLRWEYLAVDVPDGDPGVMKVWWQLQRQPWEHGCTRAAAAELDALLPKDRARREAEILAACTGGWHRRPCPKRCPKIRVSGRRHVCVKAGAKGLCPDACTRHAKMCPDRFGGGMVWREIKEKGRKTLPVPPELCGPLRDHRAEQMLMKLAAGREWEDHDLVFCQWNGRPVDPARDYREWCALLKAAGLPHHPLHDARHTAATILIHLGVPLPVVQVLLGHSDIRVTRGYVDVPDAVAQDGAARMGTVLGRARKGRGTRVDTGLDTAVQDQ